MKKRLIGFFLILIVGGSACNKDGNREEIDTEYPVIDVSGMNAFPRQCDVLKRGERFIFRAQIKDNSELGSVSVDVHHNFDHHTHSTEVETCGLEPKKTPVKPYLLIQSFPIPEGLTSFEVQQEITVPADVDPGDYHFMIRLTDKEGWQTIKGLSIKIE